jgi:hypothetical protein
MKKTVLTVFAGLLLASVGSALAGLHYVDVNSTNATPPYTTWTTGATNIQDAVDAAVGGDEIVVTNGIYGWLAAAKPVSLRSVNGPQFTAISGGAWLTNGASLSGFMVSGGGLHCQSASEVVSNCVISGVSFVSYYPYPPSVFGAASGGTLNNCTLSNNSAATQFPAGPPFRVGAYGCTLNNCTVSRNSGDGADQCVLNNCALTGNSGWGASGSRLNNCTLAGNSRGGASSCVLTNCIVYFNTGSNYDSSCTLDHCCTTPLPAGGVGNISADPELASASHLSAFSPCIGKGYYPAVSGTDIDGGPWANPPSIGCDEYHAGGVTGPLSVGITASFTNVAVGYSVDFVGLIEGRTDLSVWEFGDGDLETNEPYTAHAWSAPGDYQVSLWDFNDSYPGGTNASVIIHVVTGLHYVAGGSANPAAPYASWSTAATNIQDAINAVTEAGGQVLVTNATYAPITAYNNSVRVRSVNGALFTVIDGGKSNPCASLGNGVSLTGFTLTNGSSGSGGGAFGGTLSNCVLSGNSATDGGGAAYCTLNNCILSGNDASDGGGAYACTLNYCALTSNSANYYNAGEPYGGGAAYCTLNNCTLSGNSAFYGGGAYGCALNNCTLAGNSAFNGGGVYGGFTAGPLNNCIIYFNIAPTGANYAFYDYGNINYCCTTPQPTNGFGNITNAPLFVDTNGWANLRLQSNSPSINAGNNSYLTNSYFTNYFDLDGNPRIVGGTVDIGAYEYQTPTSIISHAWLQQYGLPTDGSADFADPDHDGLNNWQEWVCGTDPTNALSSLRLLTPVVAGTDARVSWQSVPGVNYFLERSTNLSASPAFAPLAMNIAGQTGMTSYTDSNAVGSGPLFYRVGVSPP